MPKRKETKPPWILEVRDPGVPTSVSYIIHHTEIHDPLKDGWLSNEAADDAWLFMVDDQEMISPRPFESFTCAGLLEALAIWYKEHKKWPPKP